MAAGAAETTVAKAAKMTVARAAETTVARAAAMVREMARAARMAEAEAMVTIAIAGIAARTAAEGCFMGLIREVSLREGEKIDDLQRDGLFIIQDPARFCFGMDAVLLSDFAEQSLGGRSAEGDRLLDLGTGTGIIPILMSAKTDFSSLTGIEIQEESADMAARSVRMNGLEERISILTGDLREADALFAPASFGMVTCNPPYMIARHGLTNPDSPKAIARHEILCTFEDVARVSARLIRHGGHLCLVHRPFRLVEILSTLQKYGLETKRMRLVYPYADKEPNMVLLDAVRGGRPRLKVEPPLVVYERPGVYTEEIHRIYGY